MKPQAIMVGAAIVTSSAVPERLIGICGGGGMSAVMSVTIIAGY
ncbi:MAG: hypothetical protein P8Y36_04685 [Alphaproteobacteria bacterium]